VLENVLMEAVHDILESDDLNRLLDNTASKPADLFVQSVENEPAPERVREELVQSDKQYSNQNGLNYEEELRQRTAMDDSEIFRKRMFN